MHNRSGGASRQAEAAERYETVAFWELYDHPVTGGENLAVRAKHQADHRISRVRYGLAGSGMSRVARVGP